ncbi:unnamed protein product [Lepidochelys kempii]
MADAWRHQLNSNVVLLKRGIVESLCGSAENIICALKARKTEATCEDYILALDYVFGHLETREDLYSQFQSCCQQPGKNCLPGSTDWSNLFSCVFTRRALRGALNIECDWNRL